jgi:hypothetical protein
MRGEANSFIWLIDIQAKNVFFRVPVGIESYLVLAVFRYECCHDNRVWVELMLIKIRDQKARLSSS